MIISGYGIAMRKMDTFCFSHQVHITLSPYALRMPDNMVIQITLSYPFLFICHIYMGKAGNGIGAIIVDIL